MVHFGAGSYREFTNIDKIKALNLLAHGLWKLLQCMDLGHVVKI